MPVSIRRIPSEVIRYAFMYATHEDNINITAWKQQLQYLAVSREWRAIAMPLVFSSIFIEYCSDSDLKTPGDHTSGLPEGTSIVSNMKVIVLSKCQAFVQRICVDMLTFASIGHFLSAVQVYLQLEEKLWLGVRQLQFKFEIKFGGLNYNEQTELVDIANTKRIALQIKRSMPNVRHIHASANFKSRACSSFVGALLDQYAHQLTEFNSDVIICPTATKLSGGLKNIRAHFSLTEEYSFPKICADTVHMLELRNLSQDFPWNSFYSYSEKSKIKNFANVKRLDVLFAAPLNYDNISHFNGNLARCGGDFKMHFPQLQELSVNICPSSCKLLELGSFPDKVEHVNILCNPGINIMMLGVEFKAAEWQEVAKSFGPAHMFDYMYGSNYLLGTAKTISYSALIIRRNMHIPDPNRVCWGSLAELVIDAVIQPLVLVQFIEALPQLVKLDVLEASIEHNMPADFSSDSANSAATAALQPFKSNIKTMGFGNSMGAYSADDTGAFVKYLVAKLHKLTTLIIPERLHEHINSTYELVCQYPHLRNIKLYS